jgi:hypothetical protein
MTTAAQQVLRFFGPHFVKWAIGRVRARSMTPMSFAENHGCHGCMLSKDTIANGITDLVMMPPSDLPQSLR